MKSQSGRARPLSADERRTAILDAILPLLIDKGAAVTTAEMAAAAGIAEGTIFRVFPDKAALLHAAIAKTMDPNPIQTALAEIPTSLTVEEQLVTAAEILSARYSKTTALIAMVRSIPHHKKPDEGHRIAEESMAAVITALARLLERHRDRLVVEPGQAAILLRGLVFVHSHRLLNPDQQLAPEQIVSVLCNGILAREIS